MSENPNKAINFGAKVIGAERAAAQATKIAEKRTKFGPRVLGTKVVSGTNTPATDSKPASTRPMLLSVAGIKSVLERNPAHIDHLVQQELTRPEGPRPKAVTALLELAEKRHRLDLIAALKGEPTPIFGTGGEPTLSEDVVGAIEEDADAEEPGKDIGETAAKLNEVLTPKAKKPTKKK